MSDDQAQFRQWVLEEVKKLRQQGWAAGGPRERRLVQRWRRERPKMCRELGEKFLPQLAFVLEAKMYEARRRHVEAGWPPTDAEEQATKEWLLLEPETENESDQGPLVGCEE
jgi:hypothetical protein